MFSHWCATMSHTTFSNTPMRSLLIFAAACATAIAAAADAATAALPRCTLDDVATLKLAIHDQPLRAACEADIGSSLDAVERGVLSLEQADAFANSSTCKELFQTVQTKVDVPCLEFHNYLPRVSWDMVSQLVHVVGYPPAANDCDLGALQFAGMSLSISSSLYPCLAATGLASNYMTHSTPVAAQWQAADKTPACHSLFGQAQDVVMRFPACNIQGINIHAAERVSFPTAIQWVELATDMQREVPDLFVLKEGSSILSKDRGSIQAKDKTSATRDATSIVTTTSSGVWWLVATVVVLCAGLFASRLFKSRSAASAEEKRLLSRI
ncbi:unnamed protein product [Aphanomyces euteiches]